MKFDVFNRWSGKVQFTAEIDCAEGEWTSVKLGLAARWAFANEVSLDGARLVGARLVGASLDGASLDGARLVGARLDGASLDGASLDGASLDGASLVGARLDGASLVGASLVGASLDGARLDGASLVGARLDGASLDGASLDGARLDGARLVGARLDGASLRSINGDVYKLGAGQSLFFLGRPNDWHALTFVTDQGEQRVFVGCRDFTIAKGRKYWAGKPDRREVMAALDYAEAVGRARSWGADAQVEAAE